MRDKANAGVIALVLATVGGMAGCGTFAPSDTSDQLVGDSSEDLEEATGAVTADASPVPARTITLGDVTAPPTSQLGSARLRAIAEEELAKLDPATLPTKRVKAALKLVTELTSGPIDYKIEGKVTNARTGAFIATVQGGARSNDPPSPEFLDRIVHAAVAVTLKNVARAAAGP